MSEKIPEPNSLDSMEGVSPRDVSLEQSGQILSKENADTPSQAEEKASSEQPNAYKRTESVAVPSAEKEPGIIRLPPDFYREMIVLSHNQYDKETFDKFKKAITSEEKGVIERDAFKKSQENFQKFSGVLSSLDFTKGDLSVLHDALDRTYDAIAKAISELHVIKLVTESHRYESLIRLLDKAHVVMSHLKEACREEEDRQKNSVWVRMFGKDRTKIITMSQSLKDFQQGIAQSYDALSHGENIDHATYARLMVSR